MPIIESTYGLELDNLHRAVKALDRALDERGRQGSAIFLQSYYLVRDAARLYEENDRLEAENERLKRFAKFDESTISTLNACIDDAQLENAKLRDLVRKMRYGATWTREAREYIETQMRELGIEVDA